MNPAIQAFSRLPPSLQVPSLHPEYVIADSRRVPGLLPEFFVYEEGGHVFYHPLHRSVVSGTEFHDLQSAYGYGGPVSSTEETGFIQRANGEYSEWCRDRRILAEFIRFHPLLENERFYEGEVGENRTTVWIDLTLPDVRTGYHSERRRLLRRAAAYGLKIEWRDRDGLDHFRPLYEAMLEKNRAAASYHFPAIYFDSLLESQLTVSGLCRLGDKILAAALFLQHGEFLEYHLAASSSEGNQKGAMTLLLHEAALWGQQRGCRRFHLGGGTAASLDNPLLFFKAGFSPQRARFKIGKRLHDPDAYQALRESLSQQGAPASARVLFYRP